MRYGYLLRTAAFLVRTPRARAPRGALATVALLGAVATVIGAEPPSWPPDPSLVRYPEEITIPQDEPTQGALRSGHVGLGRFLGHQPGWKATIDPYTGSVDRAFGEGIDIEGPGGRAFFAKHRALFAAGLEEAGSAVTDGTEGEEGALGVPGARFVAMHLMKDGLPVLGAGLTFGIRDEKVVLIVTRSLGPVAASSQPHLTSEEALAAFASHAGADPATLVAVREPSLAFYPMLESHGAAPSRLRHALVWVVEARPADAPVWEGYFAYVDARDGEVLALFPEARNAVSCQAIPSQARGTVTGGIRRNRADDPEVVVPLPFAKVNVNGTLVTADRNGHYLFPGGSAVSALDGEFFRERCVNCVSPASPTAAASGSGLIAFGTGGSSGPPPVAGNGTSTAADRNAFYHLQQTRLLLGKWGNAFFDEIEPFVNIASTCNAFSSSYMLGFFAAGGNCNNTAEIRDVDAHELGHTWDRTDGNGINSGSLSEWKGDLVALALGGDSCVGESFRLTGGPSSVCSGVRDIDEKAPGRTDHPLTPLECPTCATLTRTVNNCNNQSHCVGEITGQATIHLLNNLRTGVDYITGLALPAGNPAVSQEQARWILERLLIAGGPPMQVGFPTSAGVSAYDAMALIDDNDANLANGTPHAAYYNAAFAHHQLEESPLVIDSAACTPLSDPIVTATLDRDPSTSLPLVRLTWVPVGGATTFDVYRNGIAGDAFLPIAQDVTAGPIIDAGVQVGATYRYFVAAVRKTGCADISPGGNIVSVTVNPPELTIQTATVSEVPGGSDGDGRIEPGERISIAITLRESGLAAGATGVTATLAPSSALGRITAGGPISYGTIPAGGSAAGSGSFQAFVSPGAACGSLVHFVLSASGNEGCWLAGFDVALAVASCAVTPAASVEVVPGSVLVVSGGGDGDGIPDNCETTTVGYQIRNVGSLPSGTATSTVQSSHPGVTFAPTPLCSVAGLAAGATAACQFSFSLGGASAAGVPFTLSASSAASPAPSNLTVTIGAETNPPVFGTQSFGFEGSLQGWTAKAYALSSARAASGAQSAHAGSITVNNICARLSSPPFLLNPSGTSTLSFNMWANLEPITDQWYDRANVHIVDLDTGQHTLVSPATGPAYNASGNVQGGICHIANQLGWAGNLGGFTAVSFNLAPFAGRRIQVEINYSTDEGDNQEGIYVDDVVITNAASAILPPDGQGNSCVVPEVSPAGSPVPLRLQKVGASTLRLTWRDTGPGLQYGLYAGVLGSFYGHGATPLICNGFGSGITCNGTNCTFDQPTASLPPGNRYFLVTGTGFGTEGTSGFASNGLQRPPSQNTCVP